MGRNKVYIINDSGHDYSDATKFGDLVFLSRGKVDSFAVNKNYRELADKMVGAKNGDYILVTSLASLNCIAGWIVGYLQLDLRLLLFKDGEYLERTIKPSLINVEKEEECYRKKLKQ